MRNAFADQITQAATENKKVVMLSGDIGNRLFDKFKEKHADRFFNCGVAEANMMGLAAGMAMTGFHPIAYTITPFITYRCFEQIRVDVCYHNVPVIIVGVGSGLGYSSLGATHHSCEDIACMRSLPHMKVVCPGDPAEVRGAVMAALKEDGPVYLRLGKKGEAKVHTGSFEFTIGKAIVVRPGDDICILSTGTVLPQAMQISDLLAQAGRSCEVVSFHTVKPLDTHLLKDRFQNRSLVVTLEEHSLIGGFGSAVAEWLIDQDNSYKAKLLRIGTPDDFFHAAGELEYVREEWKLTHHDIVQKILVL